MAVQTVPEPLIKEIEKAGVPLSVRSTPSAEAQKLYTDITIVDPSGEIQAVKKTEVTPIKVSETGKVTKFVDPSRIKTGVGVDVPKTLVDQKVQIEQDISKASSQLAQAEQEGKTAERQIKQIDTELSQLNPNEKRSLTIGKVTYTESVSKLRQRLANEQQKVQEQKKAVKEGWKDVRKARGTATKLSGEILKQKRLETKRLEEIKRAGELPKLSITEAQLEEWYKTQPSLKYKPVQKLGEIYDKLTQPLKESLGIERKIIKGEEQKDVKVVAGELIKGGVASIIDIPQVFFSVPTLISTGAEKFIEGEDAFNEYVGGQVKQISSYIQENPAYFAGGIIIPTLASKLGGKVLKLGGKIKTKITGTVPDEFILETLQTESFKLGKTKFGTVQAKGTYGAKRFTATAPFESFEIPAVGGGVKTQTILEGGVLKLEGQPKVMRIKGGLTTGVGKTGDLKFSQELVKTVIEDYPEQVVLKTGVDEVIKTTPFKSFGVSFIEDEGGIIQSLAGKPVDISEEITGFPAKRIRGVGRVATPDIDTTFYYEDITKFLELEDAGKVGKKATRKTKGSVIDDLSKSYGESVEKVELLSKEAIDESVSSPVDIVTPVKQALESTKQPAGTTGLSGIASIPKEWRGIYDIPQTGYGFSMKAIRSSRLLPRQAFDARMRFRTAKTDLLKELDRKKTKYDEYPDIALKQFVGASEEIGITPKQLESYGTQESTITDLEIEQVNIPISGIPKIKLTGTGKITPSPKASGIPKAIKRDKYFRKVESGFKRRTRSIAGAGLNIKPPKKGFLSGFEIR